MRFDEVFDVESLPESTSNDPLPAGEYPVEIERAEVKQTKAGTGSYISVMYRVIGEDRNNACIFGNLNIRNPNPKAEEIGRQQLGSLMRAIGVTRLQDTDEMIGRQLVVKINIKKDEEHGDRNEIKSWKPYGQSSAMPKKPTASQPQPSKASPPWVKPPVDETPF
jgi:hypothetical protein